MADNLTAGNPRAHRVRVFFDEVSTLIYEGMPVCYEYDATTNWFGGSVNDAGEVTATTTTAEGGQNEGKYIYVKIPLTANFHAFAGVVAKGGWCGKTTSALKGIPIDIYVPNGAIVPVRTDASTTVGVTVLGIANTDTECISGGYPVGIAWESEDCSTDNAVVLAKLDPNMFVRQAITVNALTGGVVNSLQNTFVNTSGTACNAMVHSTLNGIMASGNAWGILNYLNINAVMTGNIYIRGILSQVMISAAVNGPAHISAIHAQLGGTAEVANCEHMCALWAEVQAYRPTTAGTDLEDAYSIIKLSNGAPAEKGPNDAIYIYGGNGIEDLFRFHTCHNGGGATDHFIYDHGTGADAYVKNGTGAILKTKVDVDGVDYFIMLYSDPEEAT